MKVKCYPPHIPESAVRIYPPRQQSCLSMPMTNYHVCQNKNWPSEKEGQLQRKCVTSSWGFLLRNHTNRHVKFLQYYLDNDYHYNSDLQAVYIEAHCSRKCVISLINVMKTKCNNCMKSLWITVMQLLLCNNCRAMLCTSREFSLLFYSSGSDKI